MNKPLLVGVDVHRKRNVLAMMNSDGKEVAERLSVDNNRPGTKQTIEQLVDLMATGDYDAIQVGAEATGYYWLHFFHMLQADEFLNQWPLELYPFNPRVIAHYKKTWLLMDSKDLAGIKK